MISPDPFRCLSSPCDRSRRQFLFFLALLLLCSASLRLAAQDLSASAPRFAYGGLLNCRIDKSTIFSPVGAAVESQGYIYVVAQGIAIRAYDSQFNYSGTIGHPDLSDATILESRDGDIGPTDMFGSPVIDENDIVLVRSGTSPPIVVMSGRYAFDPRAHLFIPSAIAVDKQQHLFVVDSMTSTVQIFSYLDGHFVGWFFIPTLPDSPAAPVQSSLIAVYDKTQFYVGNTARNLVEEVDGMSHLLHVIGAGPAKDGGISKLAGIAVGPDRNLYVSDSGTASIKTYDQKGVFLREIVSKSANDQGLAAPGNLAIDSWGRVYVVDGTAIKVYSAGGKFLTKLTSYSTGKADAAPTPIISGGPPPLLTIDPHGNLYVGEFTGILKLSSLPAAAP